MTLLLFPQYEEDPGNQRWAEDAEKTAGDAKTMAGASLRSGHLSKFPLSAILWLCGSAQLLLPIPPLIPPLLPDSLLREQELHLSPDP